MEADHGKIVQRIVRVELVLTALKNEAIHISRSTLGRKIFLPQAISPKELDGRYGSTVLAPRLHEYRCTTVFASAQFGKHFFLTQIDRPMWT